MKICMFLMTEFTHDARVTKEAKTLINAGHKVVVIALNDKDTKKIEKRDGFIIERVNVRTRYLLPKGGLFFFVKYLEFLFRILIKLWSEPFDVYHAHDLETLPIGFILSKINKKPVVYDSHELYIETEHIKGIVRTIWYQIEKLLSPKVDVIIHVNKMIASVFAKRYKVVQPFVIMNTQHVNLKNRGNLLREKLNISQNDKILLYQGLISPERGADVLLETMNHLEGIVLVYIGPGGYIKSLREKVKQHKKRDEIFVIDRVPWKTLADYTSSADLGISLIQNTCLNNYYSVPNKLFEFLSAGLPVVFSDFPMFREIISKNRVGFVVDENDPTAAAEAIKKIINDRKVYEEMSKNAKKLISKKFNWNKEGEKLVGIYAQLLKTGRND